MKGFYVGEGYMGCVNGQYMLFADEADYMDYVEEQFGTAGRLDIIISKAILCVL